MGKLVLKSKSRNTSIKDFCNKRNKVLILRNSRGLGDILLHRMIFESFKRLCPEIHLTFACPNKYHDAVLDHPFLDDVQDSVTVNKDNYLICYDTSRCCIIWESTKAPFANKNRADIWADHCGIKITHPNMHVPFISNETIQTANLRIKQIRNSSLKTFDHKSPNILFAPIAFDSLRTLLPHQIKEVCMWFKKNGFFFYVLHDENLEIFHELSVPVISGKNIKEWMGLIHAADYVVAVDTSTFHYAGGIKKPLTGIFTHVDGKYRGKYYDFVLVQKHRDNGDWPCGPCYNWLGCSHPKCNSNQEEPKPCLTELTSDEIVKGIEKMLKKWKI